MPPLNPPVSEPNALLCFFLILLVPLASAGLGLIHTGLGRSRSAAHSMTAALCILSVAAGVYFLWGSALQGYAGQPSHAFVIAGKDWDWAGAMRPFPIGIRSQNSAALYSTLFGIFSVSLAALIPLGSGAERWKLGAICASTAALAGIVFPIFAHWVWGGGWLAQLGVNFGLGRGFVDAGGASTIQAVGGLSALSVAWILGPRRGKYSLEGMPTAIPGHNVVFALLGCLLAFVGWLGLNTAGALLFAGVEPERLVLIAINTLLSAAAGLMASAAITRVRFGKLDASLSANGWVGGLVASSAACPFVAPAAAVLIGLVAGSLVPLVVDVLELRLGIDDPSGSIATHAAGGLWGVLAVGLFGQITVATATGSPSSAMMPQSGLWLAQLVGIATLLGFVLPLTYGLNWVLNRFYPYRVSLEAERVGVDLHELGAGAYPEFLTHTEDFTRR